MARRRKITQNEIIDGLRRLAFGDITDAIILLYESEDNIINRLPELDLFNISEIKRPKGGGMEIKFFDRLKALDKLRELAEGTRENGATSFYEALERGAAAANGVYKEKSDE